MVGGRLPVVVLTKDIVTFPVTSGKIVDASPARRTPNRAGIVNTRRSERAATTTGPRLPAAVVGRRASGNEGRQDRRPRAGHGSRINSDATAPTPDTRRRSARKTTLDTSSGAAAELDEATAGRSSSTQRQARHATNGQQHDLWTVQADAAHNATRMQRGGTLRARRGARWPLHRSDGRATVAARQAATARQGDDDQGGGARRGSAAAAS